MSDESKILEAGEYVLVARYNKGAYRGALWQSGSIIYKVEGKSLDDAYRQLEIRLYELQVAKAAARNGAAPSEQEAVVAIQRVLPRLTSSQRAMLLAHAKAPESRMTASQLADAAGYASYSAANLQYGLLGAMLFAEMPENLPRRSDGSPIMTCAIASGDNLRAEEDQWIWKMRPHIKHAVSLVFAL